ncbi:MAG: class I SAM-dependent methyltransferase [Candidatus Neomarinimicrobiota bacterium]
MKAYLRKAVTQITKRRYRWVTRQSYVPLVELLPGPDRTIRGGPFAGTGCYYKTGLLNTLIKLRPTVCLEIGTYYGESSDVFDHYFRKYRPNGILITADIRNHKSLASDRIHQVLVYPHVENISDHHDVSSEQMLPDSARHTNDSVNANCEIIQSELSKIGAKAFDFCFVDGDHQETSLLKDLQIVKTLSHSPHYALLDDTKDEIHESFTLYQKDLVRRYEHFDFEDWPIFVGASLIWGGDFRASP